MNQVVALSALSAQSARLCLGAKMQKVREMQSPNTEKITIFMARNELYMDIVQEYNQNIEALFNRISSLIDSAREYVSKTVNTVEVATKYAIGQYIVEDEQEGKERAKYGKAILKNLSERLTERYGDGWSVETLTLCRKFYSTYSKIVNSDYGIQKSISDGTGGPTSKIVNTVYEIPDFRNISQRFTLSWSHYLVLIRIKNPDERRFYEIETAKQQWSVRQLQRQYNSSLYERLALSRDKDEVMRLASEGQVIEKPMDIIKNPLTLEFLGLKPDAAYSESKIENAIISKLQDFLLELGKGFLFEARQKRFTFKEDSYYVDLVFYNRFLRCTVLIDLKIDKLTHQDLGQMLMYVHYYDKYVKTPDENPTIGILLCKEKDDALVELTLPENANIYATEYALYLPDKKLLQAKLKEWIEEFEDPENKR